MDDLLAHQAHPTPQLNGELSAAESFDDIKDDDIEFFSDLLQGGVVSPASLHGGSLP